MARSCQASFNSSLQIEKKSLYNKHNTLKKNIKEYLNVKENITRILDLNPNSTRFHSHQSR